MKLTIYCIDVEWGSYDGRPEGNRHFVTAESEDQAKDFVKESYLGPLDPKNIEVKVRNTLGLGS